MKDLITEPGLSDKQAAGIGREPEVFVKKIRTALRERNSRITSSFKPGKMQFNRFRAFRKVWNPMRLLPAPFGQTLHFPYSKFYLVHFQVIFSWQNRKRIMGFCLVPKNRRCNIILKG